MKSAAHVRKGNHPASKHTGSTVTASRQSTADNQNEAKDSERTGSRGIGRENTSKTALSNKSEKKLKSEGKTRTPVALMTRSAVVEAPGEEAVTSGHEEPPAAESPVYNDRPIQVQMQASTE